MTTQTGNLTVRPVISRSGMRSARVGVQVILLGGTLFALLTYALTTELFAKNSPTVLHNQAIDLIESSKVVSARWPYTYLQDR